MCARFPAQAQEQFYIVVWPIKTTASARKVDAEAYTKISRGYVTELLEPKRYSIIREDSIGGVLRRQGKTMESCSDDSGCLVDAAGAYGARYAIIAAISKPASLVILNVQLYETRTGAARGTTRVQGQPLGMADSLSGIKRVLDTRIGGMRFGEIIRKFRNKVVIQGSLRASDTGYICSDVDMLDRERYLEFQGCLHEIRQELLLLAFDLGSRVGMSPQDLGFSLLPTRS